MIHQTVSLGKYCKLFPSTLNAFGLLLIKTSLTQAALERALSGFLSTQNKVPKATVRELTAIKTLKTNS